MTSTTNTQKYIRRGWLQTGFKKFSFFVLFLCLPVSLFQFFPPLLYAKANPFSTQDKRFLLQVEKDTIKYFIRFADAKTGLVRDSSRPGAPCSIASTGFALAAWAIAKERGWMSYPESYNLTLKCLRSVRRKVEHKNGFFYHMVSAYSGKRVWSSEASSMDTALLVAGALYAGEVFKGTEVEKLALAIYKRVNWKWMMNGTDLICHGWKPESGFLPYYWDMYSEHLILQALAIGAPAHPVPEKAWHSWARDEGEYDDYQVVYSFSGSLFAYQFSHAYIDFRRIVDKNIDYFKNSRSATLANQKYCTDNQQTYPSYSSRHWGLSACVGPQGYKAYGGLPGQGLNDGTVALHAVAGSIPFAPRVTVPTLKHMYEKYKDKIYSPFGFKDSFNLEANWWADEILGIDQGIIVLMIENALSETVWKRFMMLRPIQKWIELCKLKRSPQIRLASAASLALPVEA